MLSCPNVKGFELQSIGEFLITIREKDRPLGPSYCGFSLAWAISVFTQLESEHTADSPAWWLGRAFGKENRSVPVLASMNLTLRS